MALSSAMSATLSKMLKFPGLKREAKLRCPEHREKFLWMSDQVVSFLGGWRSSLYSARWTFDLEEFAPLANDSKLGSNVSLREFLLSCEDLRT